MRIYTYLKNTLIPLFTKPTLHNTLYSVGFVLLAIGLPLSKWLTGMSVFWIVGAWLVDSRWQLKLQLLKANKYKILASSAIFIVTLLGLLYSDVTKYGIDDLRHKLPILLIPFVLAQTNIITTKNLKVILHFFVAANVFAMVLCVIHFFKHHVTEPRNISMFISHIRFALFICFSVVICVYYYFKNNQYKLYYGGLIIGLIAFLIFLQSVTGIVVLTVLMVVYVLYYSVKKHQLKGLIVLGLSASVLGVLLVKKINFINDSFVIKTTTYPPAHTVFGRGYYTIPCKALAENGTAVTPFINWEELSKYWQLRTGDSLLSVQNKVLGQQYTLVRFLASKQLTKDATGVLALSNTEIQSIKNGVPNYLYQNKINPIGRIYELLYEYNNYKLGLSPNGHSVVMRIYFGRAAWQVFTHNRIIGTGTGNIETATHKAYENLQVPLAPEHWLHAHNQLLTFLATFGIIGFLCIVLAWLFITRNLIHNKLFIAFAAIILLSFLNEDTLETQAGVGFYALMLNLFLFKYKQKLEAKVIT
jgi:hypothetical protein